MNKTFGIRFLSNLQHLIVSTRLRQLGLEPFDYDQLIVYEISVNSKTKYSIEVMRNWDPSTVLYRLVHLSGVDSSEMRKSVLETFKGTIYERKLINWVTRLKRKGYFNDDISRYVKCRHCKFYFRENTKHEHIKMIDGKVVHHHGKLYHKATEMGFTPNWTSFIPCQKQSLEELKQI